MTIQMWGYGASAVVALLLLISFADAVRKKFTWMTIADIYRGPLSRLAWMIPVFGYLFLFNDTIVQFLSFSHLSGAETDPSLSRNLALLYFGSTFISLGAIGYNLFCPVFIKRYRTMLEYTEYWTSMYTPEYEAQLEHEVVSGMALQWTSFENNRARFQDEHRRLIETIDAGPRDIAIQKFSDFFKRYLPHSHTYLDRRRAIVRLIIAFFFSSGLVMLLVPSATLFIRVFERFVNEFLLPLF